MNFAVPVNVALSHSEPKSAASGEDANPDTDRSKVLVPAVNTAIVARRESLWRISSRIFGKGVRYTEIYQANQDQIRNPNRIYPGQILPCCQPTRGRPGAKLIEYPERLRSTKSPPTHWPGAGVVLGRRRHCVRGVAEGVGGGLPGKADADVGQPVWPLLTLGLGLCWRDTDRQHAARDTAAKAVEDTTLTSHHVQMAPTCVLDIATSASLNSGQAFAEGSYQRGQCCRRRGAVIVVRCLSNGDRVRRD